MDKINENVWRKNVTMFRDPISKKVIEIVEQNMVKGSGDEKYILYQMQQVLKMCNILWLRLDTDMNPEQRESLSPPHRPRPPSGFPFPIAVPAQRQRQQRPTLKRPTLGTGPSQARSEGAPRSRNNRLPRVITTGRENDQHASNEPAMAFAIKHEPVTSLPQLATAAPLRRSRIPRPIFGVSQRHGGSERFILSPKIKSAKVFRSNDIPLSDPYPRAPHPTPVPSTTRPSSRRLCPLIAHRPNPFIPTAASEAQVADALKPYESKTKPSAATSAPHHQCHLPCRPLIHCRPRANQTQALLPRRPGRTQAPTWTPPPSALGVRQSILISYYTTPPEAKETIIPAKHPRRKKALPGEFTHIPSACKVSPAGTRPLVPRFPVPPPETSSTVPSVTGSSAISQQEKQEDREPSPPEHHSADAKHSGKLAAIETVLPSGDEAENQGELSRATVTVEGVSASRPSSSDVGSEMKGMKQDSSSSSSSSVSPLQSQEKIATTTTTSDSTVELPLVSDRVPPSALLYEEMLEESPAAAEQRGPSAAHEDGGTAAMNTCVSIIIEAVEEEEDQDKEPDYEDEPMPAPPLVKTPEQGEIPSQVEEEELDNPEIKLQSILDFVKIRRNEFAKLLEEHAEIVHEINKFEGGVTS